MKSEGLTTVGASNGASASAPDFGPAAGMSARPAGIRRSSRFERWLLRGVLTACGNPAVEVRLWDGEIVRTSEKPPLGRVCIRDPGVLRKMALHPAVGFGDGYSEGRIEIEGNLVEVLGAIGRAVDRAGTSTLVGRLLNRRPRLRSHTIAASRESVHHHYDVGNEFYRLWLDETLAYTCAYFEEPTCSLEAAQVAKMDHVCRKLRLQRGERVIEAGCGWGGFALHMARKYGASVRAFNLSHEQIAFARERAEQAGLAGQVEFVEDDYRNASGNCDAFVSIGMLEHVGIENYEGLGRVIDRVLTRSGRALLHSIGRSAPGRLDPWIDKRIFPGANPPALSEMTRIFEPFRFSVLDVENLRLHYVKTLEHWLHRFDRAAAKIGKLFDERFVRTWRLYLAGSVATFAVGELQLFQVLFTREDNNDLPWTRAHLYRPEG